MEYVTLPLPAAVSRAERPLPTGALTSVSCPCCWEAQSPQYTGTQTLGPLPGTRRGPAATGGHLALSGSQRLSRPSTPSLAPRSQAKHHSVLPCWGGRGGAGARWRRVIFSRDWRRALFSLTFTGRHPLTPQPETSPRRRAGKPPPRKRKPVHSALQLILRTRSGGRGGCTGGDVPPHPWSLCLINLGSKGDIVCRVRSLGLGTGGPRDPLVVRDIWEFPQRLILLDTF